MTKKQNESIKIGISIGDVNGIGIETLIKALMDKRMLEQRTIIIYGHSDFFKKTLKDLDIKSFNFNSITAVEKALPKKINILKLDVPTTDLEPGKATKGAGKIALKSLEMAVQDLASSKFDVLVTLPINKDTIQSSEFNFPGHTEYLAKMANVDEHLMLLIDGELKVGVATGHIPLKDISKTISQDLILSKLGVLNQSLIRDFGIERPKIAVLGLNPHAGDNGLLGEEEKEIISPAIRLAQDKGILAFGPYGADGFFGTLNYKNFDGVLAMYHDQGLIPFKTLAFENGVNYTAGLPVVRTSPDHGTAYDLVGKNKASESSLRYAIHLACDIFKTRKIHREISANPLAVSKPKKKFEK